MTFYSQICHRHSGITIQTEQIIPLLLLELYHLFKPQNGQPCEGGHGLSGVRGWTQGRQIHPEALVIFVWF